MSKYQLTERQLQELKLAHKQEKNKRRADRIKSVYLLGKGWQVEKIVEALLLSRNSIRNYFQSYQEGGIKQLITDEYRNNNYQLTPEQEKQLSKHLEEKIYMKAEDIARYVENKYKVRYGRSGIIALLHRIGFTYKKPKLVPAKPNKQAQEQFIQRYQEIKKNCTKEDSIYFMDATHPHYQTVGGYGWFKKGKRSH